MATTEMKDALKRAKNEHARIAAANVVLNKNDSVDTSADGFCVSHGTVYAWLAAYDRDGPDGLADDARPGRSPFVPRARLEIVGGAKRFTALWFVELVEKRTGVKYSEPHGRRLPRSPGFAVKKTLRLSGRVPPKKEAEIWQKDTEREVETLEKDDFTAVMANESHQNANLFGSEDVYVRRDAETGTDAAGNWGRPPGVRSDGRGQPVYPILGRLAPQARLRCRPPVQPRQGRDRMCYAHIRDRRTRFIPVRLSEAFWRDKGPGPFHFRESHIHNRRCTNNGHERFNGTLGEFLEGSRGLTKTDQTLVRASLLHYDLIRPHRGLGGIAPAAPAGINVRRINTWLTMIQHAALAAA